MKIFEKIFFRKKILSTSLQKIFTNCENTYNAEHYKCFRNSTKVFRKEFEETVFLKTVSSKNNILYAMKDYYEILEISSNATLDDIKRAYKSKALKFHPDIYGVSDLAFYEIQEAYKTLSDMELRKEYDREFFEGFWENEDNFVPIVSRDGEEVYMFRSTSQQVDDSEVDCVFCAEFFNESGKPAGPVYSFEVSPKFTLNEFVQSVVLDGLSAGPVLIKFPAKLWNGAILKVDLSGKSAFLQISVQHTNCWNVADNNIFFNLILFPWDIALGKKTTIPFLDGDKEVWIDFSNEATKEIVYENLGCFNKYGQRGNFYVTPKIVIPTVKTMEEKSAWQTLERLFKKSDKC